MRHSKNSSSQHNERAPLAPVSPTSLRLACLEAAKHQIEAERALMEPWARVRQAPIPPGARWLGEDDPFPQLYPLGSWGRLVADLRQDIDILLLLGAAPTERLWTARDSQDADSQHVPDWRQNAAGGDLGRAVGRSATQGEAATRRLVFLGAAAQLVEIWHRLVDFSGEAMHGDVLSSLQSLTTELLIIGRAPDHGPAALEGSENVGSASPSTSVARSGALPFPGSEVAPLASGPGSFWLRPASFKQLPPTEDFDMKPERIGLGIQNLSHWRQESREDNAPAFHSSLLFTGPAAAQQFTLRVLKMAMGLDLDLDAELVGSMLVLHLPGANQPLSEKHLQFARGVESLTTTAEAGLSQEPRR